MIKTVETLQDALALSFKPGVNIEEVRDKMRVALIGLYEIIKINNPDAFQPLIDRYQNKISAIIGEDNG